MPQAAHAEYRQPLTKRYACFFKCAEKRSLLAQNKGALRWMNIIRNTYRMACRRLHETLRTLHPTVTPVSFCLSRGSHSLHGRIHTRAAPVKPRYSDPVHPPAIHGLRRPSQLPARRFHAHRISGFLTMRANCVQSPSATCKSEWHTPQASHLDQDISGLQLWLRDFFEFQGLLEFIQDRGLHFDSLGESVGFMERLRGRKCHGRDCMRRIHFI